MNRVEQVLRQEIEMGSSLGLPNLMQRAVLNKGKAFELWQGEQPPLGRPNECFSNSFHMVEVMLEQDVEARYVEGYICPPDIPYLIHHAWVEFEGKAMEITIPRDRAVEKGYEYWGVSFHLYDVMEQMDRLGHYGILSGPAIQNLDLLVGLDQSLRSVFKEITGREIHECL